MRNLTAMALLLAAPMLAVVPQTAPGATPMTFSKAKLRDYARALVEVQRVQSTLAAQVGRRAAGEQAALAQQANAAMVLILQRHRLEISDFNAISRAVENRADVRLLVRQDMIAHALGFDQG